jgi:multidrug efflux system membrane fusion protein
MFWHKLKTSVAIILAFAGILAGGGLAVHLRANAGAQAQPIAADETPKAQVANPEREKETRNAADAARLVKVMQPVRREFTPYEDFEGRLEALQTVEVRARVSGQLEKISFKAGAEVKKGDVLFEIDSNVYRLAVDKAEAELSAADARRKLSEADFTRARKLQEAERIAQGEYDQIKSQAATAEANWKVAKAALDHARLNLEATKIRAPVAGGVIGQPRVDLGNHVMEEGGRSLLLATITSLDSMRLSFYISERSFLRYRRMMRDGEVRGPGSVLAMRPSDEDTFSRKGTLDGFDVQIEFNAGMRARGIFPNSDRMLFPGMAVSVRMPFGKPRQVMEVPVKAVLRDRGTHDWPNGRYTLLVVHNDDLVELRAVEAGQVDADNMIVIEKGLREDDWVVADYDLSLNYGKRVKFERIAKPKTSTPAKK